MIKDIASRLERLEKYLNRAKPSLRIYFKDGTTTTADAGAAIDLIKAQAPAIDSVEDCQGANGMLADLLTGICGED